MAKILAVDDNKNNLMLMRFLLEQNGHDIDEAMDGEEALALALKNDYAIILMDVNMPVMDGITSAKKIREVKVKQKILAVSAGIFDEEVEKIKASEFDGFIEKPFEPMDVVKIVNSFIESEIP